MDTLESGTAFQAAPTEGVSRSRKIGESSQVP